MLGLGAARQRCGECTDRTAELFRRIKLEFTVELPLLRARWKQVLFGAVFQYVHAMSTQLAHRMHQPQEEPLGDVGFTYLPELGLRNAWVSESIFWTMFIPFIFWSFSPFVTARKRFYTAVLYARLLMVLVVCQILRIISFSVTQLPAPNYHCRAGEATAVRDMPDHWTGHVVVDLGRQATHGCGDLVFSSHTTFVLVGVLTYTEYGSTLVLKLGAWLGAALMGLAIVASRKHYSVDVVVAWYVVPLVFYAMHRRWTTKRPVQDYWPHRPLMGEEEVELQGLGEEGSDDLKTEASKHPLLPPLLPVVSSHSRSGSRSQGDMSFSLKAGGPTGVKQPGGGGGGRESPTHGEEQQQQQQQHGRMVNSMRPRSSSLAPPGGLDLEAQREESPDPPRHSRSSSMAAAAAGGGGDASKCRIT